MGKIIYFPILAYGHLNVGISIFNHILERYGDEHELYILVNKHWEKRLKAEHPRFKYVLYRDAFELFAEQEKNCSKTENAQVDHVVQDDSNDDDPLQNFIAQIAETGRLPPKEQALKAWPMFVKSFEVCSLLEPEINKILDDLQADQDTVILNDQMVPMPFIMRRNIPWAMVLSAAPLVFGSDDLPPCNSGLRMNQKEEWEDFRSTFKDILKPSWDVINNWLIKEGCRGLRPGYYSYESPYFNVYTYPKELDYEVPLPGRWLQLESSVAPSYKLTKIELSENFQNKPGKLIYFSMGSTFSSYVPMMQRLLDILAQLPHKFIVSKGQSGEKLRMPENCWGENFLDQKAVLNTVDLVISHGGNNTCCETFFFGKAMIILPLTGDQHDNATRVEEVGLGKKLKPYECTKDELAEAIDSILGDEQLLTRLKQIAARMQNSNGMDAVVDEIVSYFNKN